MSIKKNDLDVKTVSLFIKALCSGHAGTIYEIVPALEKAIVSRALTNEQYNQFLVSWLKFMPMYKFDAYCGPASWLLYKHKANKDIVKFALLLQDESAWPVLAEFINKYK